MQLILEDEEVLNNLNHTLPPTTNSSTRQEVDLSEAWKKKFSLVCITLLSTMWRLTIKFNTYNMRPHATIRDHLCGIGNLIHELSTIGHVLSDEQQLNIIVRLLPHSLEHMKINITYNNNIKIFEDIEHHLELEAEQLEAVKPNGEDRHGVQYLITFIADFTHFGEEYLISFRYEAF